MTLTAVALLNILAEHGPAAVTLAMKLWQIHQLNPGPLTAADFAELDAYAAKTAADFLRAAGGAPPAAVP